MSQWVVKQSTAAATATHCSTWPKLCECVLQPCGSYLCTAIERPRCVPAYSAHIFTPTKSHSKFHRRVKRTREPATERQKTVTQSSIDTRTYLAPPHSHSQNSNVSIVLCLVLDFLVAFKREWRYSDAKVQTKPNTKMISAAKEMHNKSTLPLWRTHARATNVSTRFAVCDCWMLSRQQMVCVNHMISNTGCLR